MKKFLFLFGFLMVFLSGCQNEDCDDLDGEGLNGGNGLRLSYDIQEATTYPARSYSSDEEGNQINSFYILFF